LPLARKIDALFASQQSLTYEQLIAHRPTVAIDPNVTETDNGSKRVAYTASAPEGRKIVCIYCTSSA